MRRLPSESERLELLNQTQPDRPWKSCAEKRVCLACERTFRGSAVALRKTPRGEKRVACPGCGSAPVAWVRTGNPLLDEEVWTDWERAIAHSSAETADDELTVAR